MGGGRTCAGFAQSSTGTWVRVAHSVPERWQRVFVIFDGSEGRRDGSVVHRRTLRGGSDGMYTVDKFGPHENSRTCIMPYRY